MSIAKEARKHKLGPLHPSFKLLQRVQDTLLKHLPEDAHVRGSGKLSVSLTRVSDVKNVLVSEFDSREELIQVYFTAWSHFHPAKLFKVQDTIYCQNSQLYKYTKKGSDMTTDYTAITVFLIAKMDLKAQCVKSQH